MTKWLARIVGGMAVFWLALTAWMFYQGCVDPLAMCQGIGVLIFLLSL